MGAAGLAAGAVSGLFGTGGGLVLLPLLTYWIKVDEKELFPSSVTIMLPICMVSLIQSLLTQPIPWKPAIPYLAGGIAGGAAAVWVAQKIRVHWLHRILGLLAIWGGIRFLC